MGVSLREVIPDGTGWGTLGEFLPDWKELEFGQDYSGAGSITFKYANDGANFDKLADGMFVTPVVDGNRTWYDSIYYVEELSGSRVPGPDAHITTFAGASLLGRLGKVRWMPAIGSEVMDNLAFTYNDYTPGEVIKAGVENYLSRARNQFGDPSHWLQDVYVAPDTHWFFRVDEVVEPTTSVQTIIEKYKELGIATARFVGFNLQTSHYDWYTKGLASDKTETVQFRVGLNLINAEYARSNKELYTAVLVRGAQDPFAQAVEGFEVGNNCVWVTASQEMINKWGYHETVYDVSEASNHDTLRAIGQVYLDSHIEPRYSMSYTIADNLVNSRTGEEIPTPKALVDFQCGDLITVVDEGGASEQRVFAITMSYTNPEHANIAVTLNDFFQERDILFDQRLKRLEG